MDHPIHLSALTEREAVADAMYRCLIGIDTNNRSLHDSAWVQGPDALFKLNDVEIKGSDVISDRMLSSVGPMDTTHHASNVRVDLRGPDTAYLTCTALAQHFKPGDGLDASTAKLTTGALYFIDAVKDSADGTWKIKEWRMKLLWREGDRSVIGG